MANFPPKTLTILDVRANQTFPFDAKFQNFLPAAQRLGQVEGFVGSSSWEDDFLGKIRCTSSWEDDFLFFSFGQYFTVFLDSIFK